MSNKTLAIIKPDAVAKNVTGEIIARIQKAGFKILNFKLTKITDNVAKEFYAIHKERSFFND